MENESNKTIDGILMFYMWLFSIGGMNLVPEFKKRIQVVRSITILICVYTTTMAIFVDIFHDHDLVHKMENIRQFNTMLPCLAVEHFIRLQNKKLIKLMDLARAFTWDECRSTDAAYKFLLICKKIVMKIIFFCILFHITHFISSSIEHYPERRLSLNSYYPYDWTISPLHELTNITQIIAIWFDCCMGFSIMGLYATFVCIGCSQIEKLKRKLLEIKPITKKGSPESLARQNCSEEDFKLMQEKLKNCIEHHKKLIEYILALEDTFKVFILFLSFLIMSGLCLSAFSLVLNWGDFIQMSQAVVIYCALSVIFIFYCWFGDMLTEKVGTIKEAAYGCDWIGAPVPIQKTLLYVIAASNKEFKLTAGKVIPVSNQTMMNVFQETFSLFMFLLQVRDKADDSTTCTIK